MNRFERYHLHTNSKPFYIKGWFHFLLAAIFLISLIFTIHVYLNSIIQIEAPEIELGRKVIVKLPNSEEIQTYENLIIEKDERLYYNGDRNKIDITGGVVVYEDWK